eukprot:363217-Chlamydomonas_euryale.AAC.4
MVWQVAEIQRVVVRIMDEKARLQESHAVALAAVKHAAGAEAARLRATAAQLAVRLRDAEDQLRTARTPSPSQRRAAQRQRSQHGPRGGGTPGACSPRHGGARSPRHGGAPGATAHKPLHMSPRLQPRNAQLSPASLNDAHLSPASLTDAQLSPASLSGCKRARSGDSAQPSPDMGGARSGDSAQPSPDMGGARSGDSAQPSHAVFVGGVHLSPTASGADAGGRLSSTASKVGGRVLLSPAASNVGGRVHLSPAASIVGGRVHLSPAASSTVCHTIPLPAPFATPSHCQHHLPHHPTATWRCHLFKYVRCRADERSPRRQRDRQQQLS